MARSMERVASGKRINRGADDAAGLAQATRMRVQATSLRQSKRNLDDAQHLLETADGGLADISNNLYRLRELAIQAATDTVTDKDRASIGIEAGQRFEEIDRIAHETESSLKLPLVDVERAIDYSPTVVDVGILVDTSSSMGDEIVALKAAVGDFVNRLLTAETDTSIGLARVKQGEDNLDAVDRVADIGDDVGVQTELAALTHGGAGSRMDTYSALLNTSGANDFPGVNDPDAFTFTGDHKHIIVLTDTSAQEGINLAGTNEGAVAAALKAAGVKVHMISDPSDNADYDSIVGQTGGTQNQLGANGSNIASALDSIATAILSAVPPPSQPYVLEVQSGIHAGDTMKLEVPVDSTVDALGLANVKLTSEADANAALAPLDAALERVFGYRTTVGAKMNRLDIASDVQQQAADSTDEARANLEDADVAVEASRLVQQQVLLQGATSVLARVQQYQAQVAQLMAGSLNGARAVG